MLGSLIEGISPGEYVTNMSEKLKEKTEEGEAAQRLGMAESHSYR